MSRFDASIEAGVNSKLVNDSFTWRYENKLTVERAFSICSYQLIPYVAVEPYYESQYKKWSTTALYAGCLFPAGKHVVFNTYYEHENNTGKRPNQQQNYIGLALYLYFSLAKSETRIDPESVWVLCVPLVGFW